MFTCIHFFVAIWRRRFRREPIFLLPWDPFSSWLNKGLPTSAAEIKGFVGPLSHQAGDDSSPSISGANFKLATGDFLSMLRAQQTLFFLQQHSLAYYLTPWQENKEKLKSFKIQADTFLKRKVRQLALFSNCISTSILIYVTNFVKTFQFLTHLFYKNRYG